MTPSAAPAAMRRLERFQCTPVAVLVQRSTRPTPRRERTGRVMFLEMGGEDLVVQRLLDDGPSPGQREGCFRRIALAPAFRDALGGCGRRAGVKIHGFRRQHVTNHLILRSRACSRPVGLAAISPAKERRRRTHIAGR